MIASGRLYLDTHAHLEEITRLYLTNTDMILEYVRKLCDEQALLQKIPLPHDFNLLQALLAIAHLPCWKSKGTSAMGFSKTPQVFLIFVLQILHQLKQSLKSSIPEIQNNTLVLAHIAIQ